MPRSRLLILLWMLGTMILLGLWAHSLARKSIVRYQNPREGTKVSLGIVAGSIEIVWGTIAGRGGPRVQGFRYRLEEGKFPGPFPDYKLGRFYHKFIESGTPPNRFTLTTIEFPIWLLIALYSLLVWPLHRSTKRREHLPPVDPTGAAEEG